MNYETLFTPFSLGNVTLKNRIIFAPTTLGLSDEEYENRIRAIAAGGCSLIILGDVPISKKGSHSLFHKKNFARYQHLCSVVHQYDCKISAQLFQSDLHMKTLLCSIPGYLTKQITADQLREKLHQQIKPYITSLLTPKVTAITHAFQDAAIRAKDAGFDLVQIHGDRMCGSFSSDLFNQRTDQYGGDAASRARFAVEAVASVHQALPDMPIDFKLAVRQTQPDYGQAGILLTELPVFLPLLEQAGVTSFHVTLANHGDLQDTIPPANHPYFSEEGCFLPYCDQVRSLTSLPICGVGGLHTPSYIETQLAEKRIDLAAMSRQLIADPTWPKKVKAGMEHQISHCIRCNGACLGGMKRHEGVHCIYHKRNPMV